MQRCSLADIPVSAITRYASTAASSAEIARGAGKAHVHVLEFAQGGVIGPHPTGFAQLFVVLSGNGWAAGADGVKLPLTAGDVVYFDKAEQHSKGSHGPMHALMVQVDSLQFTTGG